MNGRGPTLPNSKDYTFITPVRPVARHWLITSVEWRCIMGWNLLRMNGVRQKVYLCIFLSIMIVLLSPMHLDILLVISIYRWSFISHLLLIDHLIYIYFIKEPGSHELPTFYVAHLREPVSKESMHYF